MRPTTAIDHLFNQIKEDLVKELKRDGSDADGCVDALMTAKYLEKIGDHGVNIGQWEIFQETGEIGRDPAFIRRDASYRETGQSRGVTDPSRLAGILLGGRAAGPALEAICPERGRDGVFPAGRLQICHPVLQKGKLFPHLLHLIQINGGDLHSFFCLHLV